MQDEHASQPEPAGSRSPAKEYEADEYEEVDPDDVVEDAIELFGGDEDEPTAVERSTDGPPPPNA